LPAVKGPKPPWFLAKSAVKAWGDLATVMDAMEKGERGVNAPRSQTALTVSGPVNPPPPANQFKSPTHHQHNRTVWALDKPCGLGYIKLPIYP
jgi:hypothetical protein